MIPSNQPRKSVKTIKYYRNKKKTVSLFNQQVTDYDDLMIINSPDSNQTGIDNLPNPWKKKPGCKIESFERGSENSPLLK
jgi:hypothetical protein